MSNSPTNNEDKLLDALLALRERLCLSGFDPGLQRTLAAQQLLLRLAAEGRLPLARSEWRDWLAPVFCDSKEHQAEFVQQFQAWVREFPGTGDTTNELSQETSTTKPAQPSEPQNSGQESVVRRRLAFRLLLATTALIVTIALLAGYWLQRRQTITVTGHVFTERAGQPLGGATVSLASQPAQTTDGAGLYRVVFERRNIDLLRAARQGESRKLEVAHPRHFPASSDIEPRLDRLNIETEIILKPRPVTIDPLEEERSPSPPPPPPPSDGVVLPVTPIWPEVTWQMVMIILLPLLCWVIWQVIAWRLREAWLNRLPSRKLPRLEKLSVVGAKNILFASARERRLIIEMRRPRPMSLGDLDLPATIRETSRGGGLFTPAFSKRRTVPEYLLLIDRTGHSDLQSGIANELLWQFRHNGLYVDSYYFDRDARLCRNASDESAPIVSIEHLAARFSDHRLIIFSDGAGFVDPFTGKPYPWLSQFNVWQQRVLLTPSRQPDHLRAALTAQQFLILPASTDGLDELGQWFNQGRQPGTLLPPAAELPRSIIERPNRWLERKSPQAVEIRRLLAEVKEYLGPDGWNWFRACAVYPEITWDLVIFHGFALFERRKEWQRNLSGRLLSLLQLPWFRQTFMPDWLREALVEDLSRDKGTQAIVRRTIDTLLRSAVDNPSQPVPLRYAIPNKQSWRERLRQWLRRENVRRSPSGVKQREPLHDYVFLNFIFGHQNRLGINLPEILRRLLYRDGLPPLGFRPIVTLLTAVIGSLAIGSLMIKPNLKPVELQTPFIRPAPPDQEQLRTLISDSASTNNPPPSNVKVTKTSIGYRVDLGNGVTLDLIAIPGGEFLMGSENVMAGVSEDKYFSKDTYQFLNAAPKPVHRVRIAPFNIGMTEVTQAQWRAVMGTLPDTSIKGDTLPVARISWDDAVAFCRRLTKLTGFQFRLPTEAEWEYAARAGTTTLYSFGDDDKLLDQYAWYDENSGSSTQPVAKKLPNPWGLYDMHGNVLEWCADRWHDNYQGAPADGREWTVGESVDRVARGGSWGNDSDFCRSAARGRNLPDSRSNHFGLRLVVGARTSSRP